MRSFFVLALSLLWATTGTAGNIKGKVTAKGARNAAGAVIYIDRVDGKKFEPPKKHTVIDQKNLVFEPHILPILKGTTVDFRNSDDVMHNVFSPDKCTNKFNLGSWPKGQIRSYTFENSGCTPVLLCNVHPEMEAYVIVLENPYYAVAAKDGSYTIENVPPGTYTLKIWHEKLKGKSVEITIPETGDVTQDFLIKR